MKISVISEAFVSDMHCRWCHMLTAVAIYHSHWMHCRPFFCTKHKNKPKMTADTMVFQLWIMVLCSVRRHSCQMHMWVTSCHITYAQAQHDVWTHTLSQHATSYLDVHVTLPVLVCLHHYVDRLFSCHTSMRKHTDECVSLHCGASERHVWAYTVVQVRDMCQLTLWCKWDMCQLILWCKSETC